MSLKNLGLLWMIWLWFWMLVFNHANIVPLPQLGLLGLLSLSFLLSWHFLPPFFNPALTFCHLLRVRRRWNLFAHAQPKVFLCKVFQGHGFASDWEYEEAHGEDTEGIVARVAYMKRLSGKHTDFCKYSHGQCVGSSPVFENIVFMTHRENARIFISDTPVN